MRAVRIILIVAVVLGGLFVAADRLAVHLAESEAADKIRSTQGLTGTPEVSIKGFPFLTQVVRKELDEVEVHLDQATASAGGQSIRIAEMTADLHDVRIGNNFSSATADRATGSARITYGDLTKTAPEGVSVAYGGADKAGKQQVKVTTRVTVPVFGRTFERSVLSTVSVTGDNTVRLRAHGVPGAQIPGLERLVRGKIDFDRQISGLPAGLKLNAVKVTQSGVVIGVTGNDVELAG